MSLGIVLLLIGVVIAALVSWSLGVLLIVVGLILVIVAAVSGRAI